MVVPFEIEEILRSGNETRWLEIKGPGELSDTHLFAKVARAALSLGNLRDGGHVIIEIDDDQIPTMLPGLSEREIESWTNFDSLSDLLAVYADPPLRFQCSAMNLSNGVSIAVISVSEFDDVPHICAKSYQSPGPRGAEILRKGALCVRPRKKPQTSEVANSVEMRDVTDLATEKALRAYVSTAERAGVTLVVDAKASTSQEALFNTQKSGVWDE